MLLVLIIRSLELLLLDSDIESTPADQIENIKVIETVFKGKTVYKASIN